MSFTLLLYSFGSVSCSYREVTHAASCNPCVIHVVYDSSDGYDIGGKLSVHHVSKGDYKNPPPGENIAWARYWSTYEAEGWDRLEVAAVPEVPVSESLKALAVGYAEGHLQHSRVFDYWTNYRYVDDGFMVE